jgi:para-aminobenzoate synthetase component 1
VSQQPHIEELDYQPDSTTRLEQLHGLPGRLLLDSARPWSERGRWDIIVADPVLRLNLILSETGNYTDIVNWFRELQAACRTLLPAPDGLPFAGGLAGTLDYELGYPLHYLPAAGGARGDVGLYDWALLSDHTDRRSYLATQPSMAPGRRRDLLARLRDAPDPGNAGSHRFQLLQPFQENLNREQYAEAFSRVQAYIQAGDCYQVNLARRFCSAYEGDPWLAYKSLRGVAAGPFSAYHDCGDRQVLSLSPERFLKVTDGQVETRPIKGTRPRSPEPEVDASAASELLASVKDRAENLMIVDLLRNDIGRNCEPGSIRVEALFELESYPAVHHLVSTIAGNLADGSSSVDLLRDCFPGGSITGAPKRRAMEIIRELEPHPRGPYCGSVFYAGADGRMDSSIAIRTLQCEAGQIQCWGGGGLVADSQLALEFSETWDKIGALLTTLEGGQ